MQTLDPLTFPLTGLSLIEASAGTGKTYTITSLYLRLLIEKNYTVEQILLVTFTKASTEELRERIHTRLYNAKQDILLGASNDLLIQHFLLNQSDRQTMLDTLNTALICLDEVSIFTIHGFCQRVLQEHAFESGSNFDSELIQDETELKQTIIEDYWRQHFYQFPTPLIPWIQKHWSQPSDLLSEINNHLGKFQLTIIPDCQYDSFAMYQQHILSTSMQLKQVWSDHQAEIIEILTEHKSIKRTSYRKDYLAKWISELTQFLQEDLLCLPKNFDRFTQSSIDKATKANAPSVNHTFFKYCEQLQELLTELAIFTHRHCLNFVNHQCQSRKQNDSLLSFDDLLKQLHDALHQPNNSYLSDKIRQQYPIAMIDEFQDTDPLQYQIFNKIYDGQAESGLFMIGDPKQAIYSFRGADIFTYMEARQKPNNQQGQYTLKTNWRSTHAMVSAVNTLFESTQQAFIFDAIEFCPVNAAAEADKTPLLIQGQSAAALQFWYLPRTADNISGNISKNNPLEKALINKDIKHDIAQQTSAHWTAQEICRLLSTDYASLNNQAIKTENIAILVYSHTQGELIKQVLNHYQLKSVLTSRNSVFDSIEADELYYLLTAVLAPDKETQLKAALATRLIGLSLAELDQLNTDSNRLNHWIQTFENYQKDWQQYSFMMMFRKMCHQQKINQQLYSSDEGERSLTNLLHLAELIQQASDEHPSLEATFNWFAEQINASNNNESRQLRLESDQQLIKIVTIHKSKGLEYDIVFVPFGWKNALRKRSKYLLFHNPRRLSENADFLQNKAKFGEKAQLTGVNEHLDQHGCRKPSPLQEQMAGEPGFNAALEERCIFGQPPELTLDLKPDNNPTHQTQSDKENLSEHLRLLYVAITRAKYRCYVSWCRTNQSSQSALAYLLHQKPNHSINEMAKSISAMSDDELIQCFQAYQSPHINVMTPDESATTTTQTQHTSQPTLSARQFNGTIDQSWRLTSFSAISSSSHDNELPDYDAIFKTDEKPAVAESKQASIFDFPKGSHAGTFMHSLFENIDFTETDDTILAGVVNKQMKLYGFDLIWQPQIENMVKNVLRTPLIADSELCLHKIDSTHRLVELEFYFPINQFSAKSLNQLIQQYTDFPCHELSFSTLTGLMKGFVDLIFQYQNKFYIVDYKSNHLGNHPDDYQQPQLQQAIYEHRYDVQYLIYTVALHRYLQKRLPNYQYQQHFGGVGYLFLRGIDVSLGADYGIYYHCPPYQQIQQLDELFGVHA